MRYMLLGLILALCAATGCTERPQTKSAAGGSKDDRLVIAVIPKSLGADFWENVEDGAREAAAKLEVEMKWEGTLTETEVAEQNKIIENMVNLDVDGIALAPLNQVASRRSVEGAVNAGIPVVVFDSEVDGTAHTSFVATNNTGGGALGAKHMIELLGDKGRVMVMRFIQGTGSTEARAKGFIDTAKAGGLEIVADPFAVGATVADCKKTASNTLESYIKDGKLELDGIFACNDRASLGVLGALEDLEKQGIELKTRFIGFDFTPGLIDGLKAGKIHALVVQNPRKMGYLAVETLVKHLRGEPVEPFIDTGVELIDAERLESDADIRRLVGLDKSPAESSAP